MAVGGVIIPEYGEHAFDADTGGIHGDEDHGLLLMDGSGWVGFAHEDGDLAAGIAGTGGPPFAAVEEIMVGPSGAMQAWMLVASEEATAGSVMAKQERISALRSGLSQRSFCSGEP